MLLEGQGLRLAAAEEEEGEGEDQELVGQGQGGSWVLWMILGGRSVPVVDDGWIVLRGGGDWELGMRGVPGCFAWRENERVLDLHTFLARYYFQMMNSDSG